MKYYAVKRGRSTGVFYSWNDCQQQISGYSGAVFKSFDDEEAAQSFLEETQEPIKEACPLPIYNEDGVTIRDAIGSLPFAYIDGSYNNSSCLYGYGGFLFDGSKYHIIQGTGSNTKYISERNIAGELIGALQVVFEAQRLNITELNIYYDYSGIAEYISGGWEAKTDLAKYYKSTIGILESDMTIHFVKVAGHTEIEGNEIADYLAKEAAGVKLRKKDIAALQQFREAVKNHSLIG